MAERVSDSKKFAPAIPRVLIFQTSVGTGLMWNNFLVSPGKQNLKIVVVVVLVVVVVVVVVVVAAAAAAAHLLL